LQEAGVAISGEEYTALRIFVVCTSPFAWATTKAQADDSTLGVVRLLCGEVREQFSTIKNHAQEFPEEVRNTVLKVVENAELALERRESKYLTNCVTEALDTLEAVTALAPEKWNSLDDLVHRYFLIIGVTLDLRAELDDFPFRPNSERLRSSEEGYWDTAKIRFRNLARFRQAMRQLMLTEASVERSFQREGEIWTAKRNRLAEGSVEDQLFVAINYPSQVEIEGRVTRDPNTSTPRRCQQGNVATDFGQPRRHSSSNTASSPAKREEQHRAARRRKTCGSPMET
jgi:hypothetical protein